MSKSYLSLALFICLSSTSFAENASVPVPAPAIPTPVSVVSPELMDCDFHFPKDLKVIDPNLIETWAQKATVKAFTFESKNLDAQLSDLKHCFTDQGWKGFNDALQKSGNLEAVKQKKIIFTATSMPGTKLALIKENQWKIEVPVEVTYQNKDHKLVQNLNVTILLMRKPTNDLGIMQVVAVPVKGPETPATPKP